MKEKNMRNMLEESENDSKEMIEVLKKIPENRKKEALRLVEGFALAIATERSA